MGKKRIDQDVNCSGQEVRKRRCKNGTVDSSDGRLLKCAVLDTEICGETLKLIIEVNALDKNGTKFLTAFENGKVNCTSTKNISFEREVVCGCGGKSTRNESHLTFTVISCNDNQKCSVCHDHAHLSKKKQPIANLNEHNIRPVKSVAAKRNIGKDDLNSTTQSLPDQSRDNGVKIIKNQTNHEFDNISGNTDWEEEAINDCKGAEMNIDADLGAECQSSDGSFKIYECFLCDQRFSDHKKFEEHNEQHNEYPFDCELCPKMFKTQQQRKQHMKCHKKDKRISKEFQCGVCNKWFSNKNYFQLHEKSHAGIRAFVCSLCGKDFILKTHLTRHMWRHNKEMAYKCEQCPKLFYSKNELTAHVRVHTGERPFKCDICDKMFTMASSLRTHRLSHTTKTIYKCDKCEKQFATHYQLQSHKIVHNMKKQPIANLKEYNIRHIKTKPRIISTRNCDPCTTQSMPDQSRDNVVKIIKPQTNHEFDNISGNTEEDAINDCEGAEINHEAVLGAECQSSDGSFRKKLDSTCPIDMMEEKIYECFLCDQRFSDHKKFEEHNEQHNEYPFDCELCPKMFKTKQERKQHMKCHIMDRRISNKEFQCGVCNKWFSNKHYFQLHEKSHAGIRPFVCTLCGKDFVLKTHLTRHMWGHNKEMAYKCEQCPKLFYSKNELTVHVRVHTGERPFKCDVCDKMFTMASSLRTHRLSHTTKTIYKCDKCEKQYSTHYKLRSHKTVHNTCNLKNFVCAKCGKMFKSLKLLKAHDLSHSGMKKHQCGQCDKSYRSAWYLKVHEKIHTGDNLIQCEFCGDWFSDPSYFKKHQRKFCSAKPVYCRVCGQPFPHNKALKAHMGLHTGERPFGCEHCGKGFAKPEALAEHVKRHSENTNFRCKYCGKCFINGNELKKHEVRHTTAKRNVSLPNHMKPGLRDLPLFQPAETSVNVETFVEEAVHSIDDSISQNAANPHNDDEGIICVPLGMKPVVQYIQTHRTGSTCHQQEQGDSLCSTLVTDPSSEALGAHTTPLMDNQP